LVCIIYDTNFDFHHNEPCIQFLFFCNYGRWYEFGERRWNYILTGESRRTRRKTYPTATLSTINPTWNDPGPNPGLRGDRPSTNDLSHGTVYSYFIKHSMSVVVCHSP
jgi:hypothetical protein